MVQTPSDLFEPQISTKFAQNDTFRPFIRMKKLPKSFDIVQLMVKKGEAFALPLFVIQLKIRVFEILQILLCIPVEILSKFIKNSQNYLLHVKVNVSKGDKL